MSKKSDYIGLMAAMLAMSSGDDTFRIPRQEPFKAGSCGNGSVRLILVHRLKRKKVGNHFSYYVPARKKNKAEAQAQQTTATSCNGESKVGS